MRGDTQETAQHMVADAVGLAASDNALKPLLVKKVIHSIPTIRVDEDVKAGKNHSPCSIKVSKAAELFKSTPGWTPSPVNVVR